MSILNLPFKDLISKINNNDDKTKILENKKNISENIKSTTDNTPILPSFCFMFKL
jgi:hypothetical protein